MFVDIARIHIQAGSGVKGCESFYRDRSIRKGKPNGGDGGNGGSVVIRTDSSIHTLLDFQYRRHFKAKSGSHGSSNNKRGKDGADCVIRVPCGTVVKDRETGTVLRDLIEDNESVIIARGGRGGKGNSKNRSATPGEEGEAREIVLELKLIADIGIIGYPNAGKSTLISKVSHARPKIASYPFTTKKPVLGVIKSDDKDIVIADIPGLIQGAHAGKGLGDKFLRHVERTRVLLHVIDAAAIDGRDPVGDYHSLNNELALYDKALLRKPQIIAANKIDEPGAKENLERLQSELKDKVYPISAKTGEGIDRLLSALGIKK